MFGLGFAEILVIVIVLLLVVGPKRLPEVARTVGRTMGQLRRATDEVKRELTIPKFDMERELLAEPVEFPTCESRKPEAAEEEETSDERDTDAEPDSPEEPKEKES